MREVKRRGAGQWATSTRKSIKRWKKWPATLCLGRFCAINHPMNGDPAQAAWARIEAALDRIERAAARPRQGDLLLGDNGLAARHEALRSEVTQVLLQLDGLIAKQSSADQGS